MFILTIILSLAAGAFVSGLLYLRQSDFSEKWLKWLLAILRAIGFALVFFVLIAPFVSFKTKKIIEPIVAVLIDNSRSMLLNADSLQIKNALFDEVKTIAERWPNAEIQYYHFDKELKSGAPDYTGVETDISRALNDVKAKIAANRLASIVLVSDGIVNRGNNPLYEAENLFVPIYTIGVGDTTPQVDLAISQIRAPEIIFRGDKIDILITVAAQNAQGKKMQFSLQQGTNIVSTKEITIADNQMATVFSATIEAKNAGILNFTAQVAALPEERNKINNKRQFSVEVIENRKKIAVVAAAPHPDVSALREALKKVEAYEVLWLDGTKSIPADVALVVVFVQPGTQAQKLESQLKGYAGSLWLFVDPMSRPNALNPFFPTVRMGESGGMATSKPILNDNFGQFGLSADAKTWLKNLPDVTISASGVNANGTFENLFAANKGTPLAQYGNADKRKMVIFSFSGLWQLRIENFKQQNNHRFIDEWLQVTAQYLTQDSRSNRLKITYSKRQPAGLPFAVAAEVYDAAFQPFAGAEVSIRLQPQKGDFLDFAIPYADGNYKTDITALEAGTYSFTATAKMGNETLKSSGNFLIEEMTLEDLDTRANFEVLKQMADASGGAFLTTKNIGDGLTQNIQTSRIEQIDMRSIPLIELKWLFFLGLLFLSIEWTLRRYFGDI